MTPIVIFILLVFSFVVVYYYSKNAFYGYSLLFVLIGKLLCFKIGYSWAPTVLNAEMIAFLILSLTKIKVVFKKDFIVYLAVFVSFFLVYSIIHSVSPFSVINEYKLSWVMMAWGLLLVNDIRSKRVKTKSLRSLFIVFLVIEIILGWLQLASSSIMDAFRVTEYVWKGEVLSMTGNSIGALNTREMIGTFMNSSGFSNYLAICFIIVSFYSLSQKKVSIINLLLLSFTFVTILFSGIRSSLAIAVIGILIIMYKYRRRSFWTFGVIGIAFLLVFRTVISGFLNTTEMIDSRDDLLLRSLSLFAGVHSGDVMENSTFSLTVLMLPYVLKGFLIGTALHNQGGYLLATGVFLEDLSTSDAQLFFILSEIGIFGTIIILYPLFSYLKRTSIIGTKRFDFLVLIWLTILLTMVDSGFMSPIILLIIYMSVIFNLEQPKRLMK